tara:strand:+ start:4087 stop:5106 length:1020 start_codon:yes stop_codon:yes gene_type:complete
VKYFGLFSLLFLISACPRPLGDGATGKVKVFQFDAEPQKDSSVLARVGNTRITVSQIQKLINKQSPYVRAQYEKDPAALDKFITGQIRYALLAEKGIALGYDKDTEVMDAAKKLIVQKLTRDVFDNQVKLADVTVPEIEKFYQENVKDYKKPAMSRLAHIFFEFGDDKKASLARAREVLPQANAPQKSASRSHFRELVRKHSQDKDTQSTGGDLRYRSRDELVSLYGEKAAKAAWDIAEVNGVSDVVESRTGYHIFKKLGVREPTNRELSEVRAQVKNRVYRQKRKVAFEAYIEAIKKDIGVTLNQERKKELRFDVGSAAKDPHGHLPGRHPPVGGAHQ